MGQYRQNVLKKYTIHEYNIGDNQHKKRLQGKKARIAILITLIVTALVEVLFRAIVMRGAVLGIANAGEQVF